MIENIDKITGSALSCTQVASNPRVNERNRTEIAVFLRPTGERLSGRGVIQYLFAGNIPAVLVDGLSYPAALKADQLKKQRGVTMAYYADLSMALDECCDRLSFVADFFGQIHPSEKQLTITYSSVCGLMCILDDIRAHLRTADDMAKELITAKGEL